MKSTIGKLMSKSKIALLIILAFNFMLYFYAPLETYFNNQSSFGFDIYKLFPVLICFFILISFISYLLCLLIYHINLRAYQVTTIALFIIYLCSYIQGNYLIQNLPLLDGSTIHWNNYPFDRLKCIILWIVSITIISYFIYKFGFSKFEKISKYITIFITLILLITLIFLCINTKGLKHKSSTCITDKNLFTYSSNANFIILVLDSVNAQDMEQLIYSDSSSDSQAYQTLLEDFTFYDNMMGGYSFTGNSVALLLSGKWYENNMPSSDYFDSAFKRAMLFDEMEKNSYELNLYYTGLNNPDEDYYRFNNIMPSAENTLFSIRFIKPYAKLIGLKYLPFDLKRFCTTGDENFDAAFTSDLLVSPNSNYSIYSPDNAAFYKNICSNSIKYSSSNQFKYIHVDGAHAPFKYDKEMNTISEATYQTSLEASMTIIDKYLQKLKNANVYDNSVIIIMADHGYDNQSDDIVNSYFYRQNPMFFVKGIDEHHDLQLSSAPVSFVDLNDAYINLLSGKPGSDIFKYQEGDSRERRWLYYEGGNTPITEYYQPKEAWNRETLYATGSIYTY